VKEFNKPGERVSVLRKDRNDALIDLLKKGDLSFDEKVKIVELIDKGIKEADESKDKDTTKTIKALAIAGGIVSIVAGGILVSNRDKKLGTKLIAAGSAALIGAVGIDTKIGKALIESFSETKPDFEDIKA